MFVEIEMWLACLQMGHCMVQTPDPVMGVPLALRVLAMQGMQVWWLGLQGIACSVSSVQTEQDGMFVVWRWPELRLRP